MNLGAWVPGGSVRGAAQGRTPGSVLPDHLSALAAIGHELTSGSTLAEGFSRAMTVLEEQLGVKRAALFIADAQNRTLTVEATYEASPEDFRPRYGQGVAGR